MQRMTSQLVLTRLGLALCAVASLAVAPAAARAERLYATTIQGDLISFDSAAPGVLLSQVAISGLGVGETIVGIDYLPVDNNIYGVSTSSVMYVLNKSTGVATAVGPSFAPALSGNNFGLDINPVNGFMRVTSNSLQNITLDLATGQVASVGTDLAYAAGDVNEAAFPYVSHITYTGAFGQVGSTTLYGIDILQDTLVTIGFNSGQLTTVGSLGLDAAEFGGFDISGKSGTAYAAVNAPPGNVSQLFTVDLATGAVTLVGVVGDGRQFLKSLTVVPEPSSVLLAGLGLAGLLLVSRRRRS